MRISSFVFFCLHFLFIQGHAQNTLSLQSSSALTSTSLDVEVGLSNEAAVKALQFNVSYASEAFQLETGHALSARGSQFSIGVSSPSPGIARVVIYSASDATIAPGTGTLVTLKFKTKTLPGSFPLTVQHIVASNTAGAALPVNGISATVEVKGPKLTVLTPSLSFGNVPMRSSTSQNLQVQNSGNLPLTLSGLNAPAVPFGVQQSFPVVIAPGEVQNLTVTLDTSKKIAVTMPVQFVNDDPDPLRRIQKTEATVRIYAVNEIYVGNGSGTINSPIQIPVSIFNTEDFSGCQLDVILPEGFSFVASSIVKSERFKGHVISSSLINKNMLRFIAYSPDNSFFTGSAGEVFRFSLLPSVSSGSYALPVSEAIISHPQMGNILSASYGGSAQIQSPHLVLSPDAIGYGDLPINQTRQSDLTLRNTGTSELILSEIVNPAPELSFNAVLPLSIQPGNSKTIQMTLQPQNTGALNQDIAFKYNGPDYQKILKVQANVYAPNYIFLKSQNGVLNQENSFEVIFKNHDALRAVQFDVELPTGFTLKTNQLATTTRSSGFNVSASVVGAHKYRVVMYTLSGATIPAGEGAVVRLPVFLSKTLASGAYPVLFSNVVLSNSANINVATAAPESSTVSVPVNAPPVVKVRNGVVVALDSAGKASLSPAQLNDGSYDDTTPVEQLTYALNKTAFTCADTGAQEVTLIVTDASGKSASASAVVSVVDNLAPALTVKDITLDLRTGTLQANSVVENLTDNCSAAPEVTLSQSSFTTVGIYEVVVTAKDSSGNTTQKTGKVTVVDSYALPDLFRIAVQDETCVKRGNGKLTVTATKDLDYTYSFNNGASTSFRNTLTIANLGAGTYPLCIKLPSGFQYCYELKVGTPANITGKITVSEDGKSATIKVTHGTAPFSITYGSRTYRMESKGSLEIPLNEKTELVTINSSLSCEGMITEKTGGFGFSLLQLYPNPVSEILHIGGLTGDSANVKIYDMAGVQAIHRNFTLSQINQIDVTKLPQGFYMVVVTSGSLTKTKKIIKK